MLKKILSVGLAAAMLASVTSAAAVTGSSASAPSFPLKDNVFTVYDSEIEYFKGIYPGTTVSEFANDFTADITVKNASGSVVDESATIGSDYTVSFDGTDGEYKTLVYGDCDSNGKVNVSDAVSILKHAASWNIDINALAADVDGNGKVNVSDAVLVLKYAAMWDVSLGYAPFAFENAALTAPAEDQSLSLTFGSNTERLNASDDTANGNFSYMMELAKNESEFCQLYLASASGHSDLMVSMSDFKNADGDTLKGDLLREEYYTVVYPANDVEASGTTHSVVPEALPPITDPIKIAQGKQQGFFIRVDAAKDQPSGLYRAVVSVTDGDENEIKRAYVYAYVWNFALADSSACKTAFGLGTASISAAHRVTEYDDVVELYTAYYEYFLDNRINIWNMPYDPITDEADEYMSDPRVNTFLVAGGYSGSTYGRDKSDEDIVAAYEKISANEEWAKKAIFYMDDEPMEMGKVSSVISTWKRITSLYPNARIIVPQHVNYFLDDLNGDDIMSVVTRYSSVLCPHETFFIDPEGPNAKTHLYTTASVEKYGAITDRIDTLRSEGKETWWYTSDTPRDDQPNILLSNSPMECRMLFWAQYSYDMDGMLFWDAGEWPGGANALRRRRLERHIGLLVYSGAEYGIDGPVSCIRTEIARDGIEDFEYLSMIENIYGEETAKEFCSQLVTSVENYSKDGEKLASVRREMAKLLEAAE